MAPLKFEDSIKEKLEERTIQASGESWKKLEQQLDDQYGQKKVKKYWWLGIAASVVGFLVITTVFMNSNTITKASDVELVDANKEIVRENKSMDLVETTKKKLESEIEKKQNEKENLIQPPAIVKNNKKKPVDLEKNKDEVRIASEDTKIIVPETILKESSNNIDNTRIDTIIAKTNKPNLIDAEVIDSKIAGIVAKVKELEKNNGIVSDDEVDALLYKAQLEITTQQILKSNTVNASALLLDVESELDESFKDRVFEALKTGFERLKTTVAERDN